MTGANGIYTFTNLAPGDYRVRLTPPAPGWFTSQVWSSTPNNDVAGDNNGVMQNGYVICNPITLSPGTEPTIDQSNGATTNRTLDMAMVFFSPTSTQVTLGGRIMSLDGHGIGRATVALTDSHGTVHYAFTNPFGYYRFTNVESGTFVVVTVQAKNALFAPDSRAFQVGDQETPVDFTAANLVPLP